MKNLKNIIITTLLIAETLSAQEPTENPSIAPMTSRPDSHAPIGVMGDHTHKKGDIMFSYRAMLMGMDGMLSGSDDISNAGVMNAGFMVTPTEMSMQMHMLGAMYAPSDRVTLMAMTSLRSNNMDLLIIPSETGFSTESGGLGDSKLAALISLIKKDGHHLHANLGLSIPTGSIEERDDIPVRENILLAYPMQTGSGSWDPSMGVTYAGHSGKFGWGAQSMFTFRVENNDLGYKLGEKLEGTAWASILANDFISFSARLNYWQLAEIQGAADELTTPFTAPNGNMIIPANFMPVFNTQNSGRKQLDLNIGSNLLLNALTKGLRLGIEVGLPVYQDVNGIQMKNSWAGIIGIQYAL